MKTLNKILYTTTLISLLVPKTSLAVKIGISPLSTSSAVSGIGQYIKSLYNTALGIAGIAAVGLVVVGGFYWSLAGGSKSRMSQAKDYITSALWGFGLLLGAFILLRTINPQLVKLESPSVPKAPVNKAAPACSSAAGSNLDPCNGDDPFPNPTSTSAQCCIDKSTSTVCNVDVVKNCQQEKTFNSLKDPSSIEVPNCTPSNPCNLGLKRHSLDVEWGLNDWKIKKVAKWPYYPEDGSPKQDASCEIYSVYTVPPGGVDKEPRWTNESINLTSLKRCPGL